MILISYFLEGDISNMRIKFLKILNKNLYCFFNKCQIKFQKKPRHIIVNKLETLNKILEGYSISRYGDGEFSLIYREKKDGIKFQDYDENMRKRLKEILVSNEKKHLVAIPSTFIDISNLRKEEQIFWSRYYLKNKKYILPFLDREKVYYDAMISRFYMPYIDKSECREVLKKFRNLFEDRNIVIIEGINTRFALGNDLLSSAKNVTRILCPAKNAYSIYDQILEKSKSLDKNSLILLALGPTATILAFDLSKLGFQAVDIGHLDIEYEWFLKNAKEKMDVENKAVNEVSGVIDKEIKDENLKKIYEAQIVHIF